jgi:uncharacterized protein (DUF2236 family)
VISRRINAERLVLAGWSRAILLQLAHPLVAAGVIDHSTFRSSPGAAVRRLRETVAAMLALTFGDDLERGHAVAAIRAIHTRVHGTLRDTVGTWRAGARYSAEDPALVLWVHATLIESIVLAYDTLIAPVSLPDRDAYCKEAADVAVALGANEAEVPHRWAGLEGYLAAMYESGAVVVGRDARTVADVILFPPMSFLSEPVAWVNRLLTLGTLPADIRDQYGYQWNATRARQFARVVRVIRAARAVSPGVLAEWRVARR